MERDIDPIDADRLRALRSAADLSQADLARLAGVDNSTISRWERRGQANPEHQKLVAVAEVLGVEPRELSAEPIGRPLEIVVEEVRQRRRNATTAPAFGQVMPQARVWGRIGGPITDFGPGGGLQYVLAHALDGLTTPALALVAEDDPEIDAKAGEYAVFDAHQPVWRDGEVHVFAYDGVVAMRPVEVRANVLSWRDRDGTQHTATGREVTLYGVVACYQPDVRRPRVRRGV